MSDTRTKRLTREALGAEHDRANLPDYTLHMLAIAFIVVCTFALAIGLQETGVPAASWVAFASARPSAPPSTPPRAVPAAPDVNATEGNVEDLTY